MGEGWSEVRYRKAKHKEPEDIATLFVTNLPGGMSKSTLWKAFQQYRRLTDAYVATLQGNGIHVGITLNSAYMELSVSVAKYDKQHSKVDMKTRTFVAYTKQAHAQRRNEGENRDGVKTSQAHDDISYKDVLSGTKKVFRAEEEIDMYLKYCMNKSVVLEMRTLEAFKMIKSILQRCDFLETTILYIGGFKILLAFKDKHQAEVFLNEKRHIWEQDMVKAIIWNGQEFSLDKLIELKFIGVPLQYRDDKTYN
ncbi:hypothetical protein R6Q59_018768 [Mikania micrantha]